MANPVLMRAAELAVALVVDDAHVRVGGGQLVGDLRSAVGRGVVDDDQLVVGDDAVGDHALAHPTGGVDGPLDVVLLVPHREEDREQGRLAPVQAEPSSQQGIGGAQSGTQSVGRRAYSRPAWRRRPRHHHRPCRRARRRSARPSRPGPAGGPRPGAADGRVADRHWGHVGARVRRLRRGLEGEPGARPLDVVARPDRRAAARLRPAAAVRRPGGDGRGDAQQRPPAAGGRPRRQRRHRGDRRRRSRPGPAPRPSSSWRSPAPRRRSPSPASPVATVLSVRTDPNRPT